MTLRTALVAFPVLALLAACSSLPVPKPSEAHIRAESVPPPADPRIPQPVLQSPSLPVPKPTPKAETYSVVVNNVRVQELLFALARDAKLNVDIHPGITGTVTLNALDQTLPQLLTRIGKQVDMRYELDGPNLVVLPDTPYLRTYKVDYVNMGRTVSGTVSINTQISGGTATAAGTPGGLGGTSIGAGNVASTTITNQSNFRFWEDLEKNIKDLLRETDKILPEGSEETVIERSDVQTTTGSGTRAPAAGTTRRGNSPPLATAPGTGVTEDSGRTVVRRTTFREAGSVIVNPETGIVTVRATSRQHEKVEEFLDQVMVSAKRQVLIEATIAEVRLSDNYQQGIDWQYLRDRAAQTAIGQGSTTRRVNPATGAFETITSTLPSAVANTVFTAAWRSGGFTAAIRLLESFGNVKVLSSPKLSVMNNQTALLKVADNRVYFTVEATPTTVITGATAVPLTATITARPNTVAVGLFLSVTPQISDADAVVLNVRPTVTRITGFVADPTPALATAGVQNLVPEIQTRELESMMRVENGEIAVLGGLMQDEVDYRTDAVPGLSKLPVLGNLFNQRNETSRKTELVVFLRPVVIRDASIAGDYRGYRQQLPDQDFFGNLRGPRGSDRSSRGQQP
jgi:general secretion pathway protein D